MTKNRQTKIHQKGMHILERLSEAIKGMKKLETLCTDHRETIRQCEDTLDLVAVDIACISTSCGEWDEMSQMIRDAGIDIPDELDHDMVQLQRGDDSCLD